MKNRSLFLILLLAVMMPWAVNAQETTVTIGDGTQSAYQLPVNTYYNYSLTQQIYTADEITAAGGSAGTISSISFYYTYSTGYTMSGVQVYMLNTDKEKFESTTDMVAVSAADKVFEGTFTLSANSWSTITLDEEFEYEGGNLLICFFDPTNGYPTGGSSCKFRYTTTTGYTSITYYDDNTCPNINNVTSFSGYNKYRYQYHNNIQLVITPPSSDPCKKPQLSSNVTTTATEATLTWTEKGDATSWTLQYGTDNTFATGTYTEVSTGFSVVGTTVTAEIDDLTPLKQYYARVKPGCDTDGTHWSGTVSFTTKAQSDAVGDAWSDDFEGTECGWELINGTVTQANWFWGTAENNGSGSHSIYTTKDDGNTCSYNTSGAARVYATKLLTFADGKYTFQFDWKCNGETNSYDYLSVGLLPATEVITADNTNSGALPTGWISVHDATYLNGVTAWQTSPEKTVQLEAGNYYLVLRWRQDGSGGTGTGAAVDNFSITKVVCDYDVTGLAVATDPAPTAHTATINWTGEASQWQVAWSTDNTFAAANTSTEIVSATTINLSSLLASSIYFVKVRAYCGGEDYGTWCSSISFATECEAITTFPWEEKFENYASGDFSAPCWSNTITSGSYKFKVSTSSNGSNSTHQLYTYSTNNNIALLVLPEMTIPSGKTYQFIVDLYRSSSYANYDDGIRVFVNNTDNLTGATELGFLYRYYSKTDGGVVSAETTYGWYTYAFDIPFDGTCYVILQGEGKGGVNTYVDNLVVRQAPDCDTPTGLALTTGSETPEGATIAWTAGDASSWIVEYKKSTEENYTTIAEPVNAPTYTFLGLDASTTYNVRVKVNCTTGDGVTFPTKPINFTTQQGCPAPKNLVVSGITANQAVLTWAPGYNETEWTVKYKKHADAEYTTADPVSTTPTITLSGLTGATAYDVQIIGCDPTHVYTVSNAFTTAYSVPFEEKFATSNLPTSWNNYSVLLSDDVLNGTTPLSGSGSWTFSARQNVFGNYHGVLNIYGTSCRSWLLTPNVTVGTNHSLSFDLALTDYSSSTAIEYPEGQADDKFIILISTNNGSTWTILRQWDNETGSEYVYNNIAAGGEMVYIDLAEYSGQTVRIAFYGESTVSVTDEDNDLHIDNVSIDVTPSCYQTGKPAASNVTNHSATLTWTPGEEGQTAWEIAYKNAVFDPNDPELDWTTVSTETINNNPTYTFDKTLDAATTYYVYVRAKCGNDYSKWCNNACNFTTKAAAPAPTALTTANVMPHSVDLGWTPGGGDYEVSWDIYYVDSYSAPTTSTEPTIAGVTENPYHITGLTDNKTYYFWVRANHSDAGASAWSSYKSQAIPEACPKPSALTTSDATPNSIKLSWTAGATWQTAWTVAYSETTNFDPTDETACTYVEADTNPFVVEGLDDNTTYYFRVKGNCGSEYGESAWNSYQASGKTLVACPKPTNVAVNNLTQNTADLTWTGYSDSYTVQIREGIPTYLYEEFENGMPSNWDYSIYNDANYYWKVGYGSDGSSTSSYANGTNNAYFYPATFAYPTTAYLITPAMNLSASSGATLAFSYINAAWSSGQDELYVYYRVNGGEWTLLESYTTDQSSWTDKTITLTGLADNYQIGFYGTNDPDGDYGHGIGIDDVKVYESSATVGEWTDATTEATNGAYTLTGLTYNTTYDVQVKGNCEGGTYSDVISFTTPYPSFTKTIEAYDTQGWYLIASPLVGETDLLEVDGLLDGDPRLYRFNQSADLEWEYYETHYDDTENPFESLVNGTGYLYGNSEDVTLTFVGTPYAGDTYDVTLQNNADAPSLGGWNLVGNPFGATAYITGEFSFYTLDNGSEVVPNNSFTSIEPMEAVFVYTEEDGGILTFTTSEPNSAPGKGGNLALNVSHNRGNVIDRAIVNFGEGGTLPKFQLNPNHTKVYIPQDNKDYAIVTADNQGSMPVNFKAEHNGAYTLSFSSEEVSFNYLHLIDNLTGAEVDLLQTPSYTFNATTTDYESRFKLVFCTGVNDDSDSFAFCSNGNWIINNDGEAILQVIDVTGRILSSETVNGSVSKAIHAAPGVYMLRLINGDNVKVQKIVVR